MEDSYLCNHHHQNLKFNLNLTGMCCQNLTITVHVKLSIASFYWHTSHNVLCVCVRACMHFLHSLWPVWVCFTGILQIKMFICWFSQNRVNHCRRRRRRRRRRRSSSSSSSSLKLYSSFYYRKFVLFVLVAILIETANSKHFLPHLKKLWFYLCILQLCTENLEFVCTENFSFFN